MKKRLKRREKERFSSILITIQKERKKETDGGKKMKQTNS